MPDTQNEEIWKHFFDRPRKNYNPYMVKLNDFPQYIMYNKSVMDSYRGRWNEYFGNKNPIYLEIGSGSGNFAIGMCEKHPERNHIALEIRFKRLFSSARKADKIDLKNVLFIRRRGEEILDFMGEEEIDGMYINFPDPWEGKESNRVLQPDLFKTLDVILKKNGSLFFKTDHDGYYADVLEFAGKMEGYKVVYHTSDLHNSPLIEENVQTEFESLFLYKHNKNINYIEVKKIK